MPFAGYKNFDDCVAKNKDKGDPKAYCGSIQAKVEEVDAKFAKEQDQAVDDPESLTTPNAGNEPEGTTKDLTSPQGSSREAENPQASGRGELSPTNPPQDQAEPEANPQDQAEPENAGHQKAGEQDAPDNAYGNLNGKKYAKNEDKIKDEKREEQQGKANEQDNGDKDYGDKDNGNKDNGEKDKIEYEGESYHKVEALEYNEKIYVPKCTQCPKQARENDLDYEGILYEEADDDVLQLDDDYYVKDEEQAPQLMPTGGEQPVIGTPELNPVVGESIILKENGKYRKYNVFTAREQEEDSVEPPAEVKEVPKTETPASEPETVEEPKVEPIEQKDASEEIKAVEKIIVKENGKLKFKSVFQEVKKKL